MYYLIYTIFIGHYHNTSGEILWTNQFFNRADRGCWTLLIYSRLFHCKFPLVSKVFFWVNGLRIVKYIWYNCIYIYISLYLFFYLFDIIGWWYCQSCYFIIVIGIIKVIIIAISSWLHHMGPALASRWREMPSDVCGLRHAMTFCRDPERNKLLIYMVNIC